MRDRVETRSQDANLHSWKRTINILSSTRQALAKVSWVKTSEHMKKSANLLRTLEYLVKRGNRWNTYHEYITDGSICSRKRKRQRPYLNINRGITKSNLNQTRNPRLNLFTLYRRKNWQYFANTWQKMKKKDLLKNSNHEQNTRSSLHSRRTKNFAYVSIIKSWTT